MKILEKQQVESIIKTFRYTLRDRRKLVSIIIVLMLPLILFSWRFIPDDIDFPYYGHLHVFIWTFNLYFVIVMLASAWFLSIPQRDFAMQIIVLAALFLGISQTFNTLPFSNDSPWWIDILVILVLFLVVSIYLYYVHNNYVNRNIDYKQLHDGIVHDLHHQRFLNSISRVEGLINIAEMEEPYKSMCADEIAELKKSVAYVAEKYKELY
ncbi:MAG: hypothetical protein WBA23_09440 [Tunicatimonas sp.]|uniref:hypothetical protein n=1 Tax=Tunicatimonas sp. TaxID=1940096 RepID=UPI003C791F0E